MDGMTDRRRWMGVGVRSFGLRGVSLAAFVWVWCAVVPASAQQEVCVALSECLLGCPDGMDEPCTSACFEAAEDPEAVEIYTAALECINDNGCALDDEQCLQDFCLDEVLIVGEYCGFGDEEPEGGVCDALGQCLGQCPEGDLECFGACAGAEESPEAREVFENLLVCIDESGCEIDDDECLVEACADELVEFEEVCDFEDDGDEEDNICAPVLSCIDGCGDFECIGQCVDDAEDPEAAEVVGNLVTCIIENGCEDDDDCLLDNCREPLEVFGDVCGFEDDEDDDFDEDDLGNETDDGCEEDPGPDCCFLANDGECDEPDFCAPGTDTTDCQAQDEDENDDFDDEGDDNGEEDGDEGFSQGGDDGDDGGCATTPGSSGGGGGLILLGLALIVWRRRR